MNNQEYELDLVDLGKTILKRWKLLALVTVIVAAVGGALSMASRPEYRCSALIAVNVRSVSNSILNEDSDSSTNSNTSVNVDTDASGESALLGPNFQIQKDETSDSASKTAIKSKKALETVSGTIADRISILAKLDTLCKTLLTQEQVLRNVAEQCNTSVSQVRESVSVGVIKDTNLLEISAVADDPELAKQICGELANEAQNILMPAFDADSIEIVSAAQLPGSPVSKGMARKAVVAVLVGLILSIVYVVLDFILMPKVHTEWMVKNQLGLKLLGTVPAGKEKKTNG